MSHTIALLLLQLAVRLVKSDTIAAVKTIQDILESEDDHGVVDVFQKYPTQQLISAIYALSRLQTVSDYYNHTIYSASSTRQKSLTVCLYSSS